MRQAFCKRIYTFPELKADIEQIFDHIDNLRHAARGGRVSKSFSEKLMLVVSTVNGCQYCCYGHSRAALAAGISKQELQDLLALELGKFPIEEVTALTFAQHFAESHEQPDPTTWERMVTTYGEQTAQDILAYLRMITFGNLLGNTFDALLSRILGKPAPGSSLRSELSVLFGALWMPPVRLARQRFSLKASGV